MIKYLELQIKRLKEIKNGVEKHEDKWKLLNENPQLIEEHIRELEILNDAIANTKQLLSEKLSEARKMKIDKSLVIERLEKKAIGLHADEDTELDDYKINSKKLIKAFK